MIGTYFEINKRGYLFNHDESNQLFCILLEMNKHHMVQRQLMRSLLDILATSQHLRLQGSEVSETVVPIFEDCRINILHVACLYCYNLT